MLRQDLGADKTNVVASAPKVILSWPWKLPPNVWEAEMAWAKETNVVKADTRPPDFRGMIEESFLKKVAPEFVKIR